MTIDKKRKTEMTPLPHNQVYKRFLVLATLALVLIAILVGLTLAVLEANDLEPFAEIAQLLP